MSCEERIKKVVAVLREAGHEVTREGVESVATLLSSFGVLSFFRWRDILRKENQHLGERAAHKMLEQHGIDLLLLIPNVARCDTCPETVARIEATREALKVAGYEYRYTSASEIARRIAPVVKLSQTKILYSLVGSQTLGRASIARIKAETGIDLSHLQ